MNIKTRPPTPVGWSDTDWIKHLQEQTHPLDGLHINKGSMDAAADAYEAEYNAAKCKAQQFGYKFAACLCCGNHDTPHCTTCDIA